MENKTFVRINFAMLNGEDCGIDAEITCEMAEDKAWRLLSEQEECGLVAEDGDVIVFLDAYARMNGWDRAVFLEAFPCEGGQLR